MSAPDGRQRPRSVVLIHGLWSSPHDWRWVVPALEDAGLHVVAVDLPSHSSADAGARADADAVRDAIRSCEPPVVVAAWSSGGDSLGWGADGEPGVARLVYVASYPTAPHGELPEPAEWIDSDPNLRRLGDGTFVLDTDVWLDAEAHLFDAVILAHLREHRRRPVSLRALTEANPGRAWAGTPFTVVLGRSDPLIPADDTVREITDLLTGSGAADPAVPLDIRLIDCDHFIPFREPRLVADVILEPVG